MNRKNQILDADSYKFSHYLQLPEGTTAMYDNVEPRVGSIFDDIKIVGLQIWLKDIIANPITMEDVEEAKAIVEAHGEPFNYNGFKRIVEVHGGHWPVKIKAVPEGMVVPKANVVAVMESTDPELPWVPGFLETAFQRAIWYPTTVATISYHAKQTILNYLEKTSDDPNGQIAFKLHDFGCRGVSSYESAAIGGLAHLVNFMGTDTIPALTYARKYYGADMPAFSIPAAEHSTITSWGKENEAKAYENMLRQFAKPGSNVAVVSDSYDIYYACSHIWGWILKEQVIKSGATVIIRPDSGDPAVVPLECTKLLGDKFGYTVNSKGFKVLNNVRVIQGDGIDLEMIGTICENFYKAGWSIDNIAFGMGGGLLQKLDRDTCSFAMKCSAILVDGQWIDVFKDPITQSSKKSKKGRVSLYRKNDNGELFTAESWYAEEREGWCTEVLVPVYENGKLLKEFSFDELRSR